MREHSTLAREHPTPMREIRVLMGERINLMRERVIGLGEIRFCHGRTGQASGRTASFDEINRIFGGRRPWTGARRHLFMGRTMGTEERGCKLRVV